MVESDCGGRSCAGLNFEGWSHNLNRGFIYGLCGTTRFIVEQKVGFLKPLSCALSNWKIPLPTQHLSSTYPTSCHITSLKNLSIVTSHIYFPLSPLSTCPLIPDVVHLFTYPYPLYFHIYSYHLHWIPAPKSSYS
jgi:hypothetical protein